MKRRRKNIEWVTSFYNLWPVFTGMLSLFDVLTLGETCKTLERLTENMIDADDNKSEWDIMREAHNVFKSNFRTRQWVHEYYRGVEIWTHVKHSQHCLYIDFDNSGIICSVHCTVCECDSDSIFCKCDLHMYLHVIGLSSIRGRGSVVDCVKRLQQLLLSKDADLKECNEWCWHPF